MRRSSPGQRGDGEADAGVDSVTPGAWWQALPPRAEEA